MGFCQGGSLTLIAAQQSKVACAAPFYGVPKVATGCHIIERVVQKLLQVPAKLDSKAASSAVEHLRCPRRRLRKQ